jgi:hypothetical protein
VATGEDLLERAHEVAEAVQQKVRQAARHDQDGRSQVDAPAGAAAGCICEA